MKNIRSRPIIPADARLTLDVGCGDGQSLEAAGLSCDNHAVGIDISVEALVAAKHRLPRAHFSVMLGEALSFPDGVFDSYISRVAWPYMWFPDVVQEAARVLRPGGHLWVKLHFWPHIFDLFVVALRDAFRLFALNTPFRAIYLGYVLVNGLILHLTGRTVCFPFNRRRTESFQTSKGMLRLFHRAGFERIEFLYSEGFVVTAVKR